MSDLTDEDITWWLSVEPAPPLVGALLELQRLRAERARPTKALDLSLSDSEAEGLAMIRTGDITSASKAEMADRWIDRVLAERCGVVCLPDESLVECETCIGVGRIRDGETNELRRCLDCGGAGQVAVAYREQPTAPTPPEPQLTQLTPDDPATLRWLTETLTPGPALQGGRDPIIGAYLEKCGQARALIERLLVTHGAKP